MNSTSATGPASGDVQTDGLSLSAPASPTPSTVSLSNTEYSYSSSINRDFVVREVFGRSINNTSERYTLPADLPEHERLTIQHQMFKRLLNGLYAPNLSSQIRRLLRRPSRDGVRPAVLDVGTGSGAWAIDMARAFPGADVVGMDLVPAILSLDTPINVRFECDDANIGLAHYVNAFDVIHVRCCSSGIESYKKFLMSAWESLRPGGVLITFDGFMELCNENRDHILALNEGEEGFTWMNKIINVAHGIVAKIGPGVVEQRRTLEYIREMGEDYWKDDGIRYFYSAIGPWDPMATDKEKLIAELQRQDFFRLTSSFRPLLLSGGVDEATVDRMIDRARDELWNLRAKQYVQWYTCWAIKK